MKKLLLILALTCTTAGCVRVQSSHVLTGPALPPSAGGCRIVMEGQQAEPGFTEVAIVEGRGGGRARMSDVIAKLQSDAQLLGANAIINVRVDQGATMLSVTGVAVRY